MPCSTWVGSVSGLGLGLRVRAKVRKASSTLPLPELAFFDSPSSHERFSLPFFGASSSACGGGRGTRGRCIGPSGGHPALASPGPARLALGWAGLVLGALA